MSAEEVLRNSEKVALGNNQIVSHVTGKVQVNTKGKKLKSFTVMLFITAMIAVAAILFSSGNLIPSAILERLVEETDVQYADAVESKKLVFQQAMQVGELPDNTIEVLRQSGVETEKTENGEVVLKIKDKTVTAANFINEVNSDAELYNAFDNATYSRAAYYYDDAAKEVFKKIGTTRNNFTADSDFNTVMSSMLKEGSNVSVNNVGVVAEDDSEGYSYETVGAAAKSSGGAVEFVSAVGAQNAATTETEATLNSADALKVADATSKEQRSKLFFALILENISKMMEGSGNDSKINEVMNYLYESAETEVVDVKTGEVLKVKGAPLESPSLYAILSGSKVDMGSVGNYSSDRILKTVENRLGSSNGTSAIIGTVASTAENIKGSISRVLNGGGAGASKETLSLVDKTVNKSLVNNSYETIKGIDAGEFLVEGAINLGKDLAKASGATAGDGAAVKEYARLNSQVLAMDAAADRMNRSPFDITSKNTFLGSIMRKLAVASAGNRGLLAGIKTFSSTVGSSVMALVPGSYADAAEGYLTEFGDCETYGTIGAVGSAQCSEIATFDLSTLKDTFNDAGFQAFVEANTTVSASGKRTINKNSTLADFILYNDERTTPLGVVDGGILESLGRGSSSVNFVSNILGMIQTFLGASEGDKRIATGAEYVNSSDNPAWQDYKYAQRYVSLARATEALRQYSGDTTSYMNIRYFEGIENPVIAFLSDYYAFQH